MLWQDFGLPKMQRYAVALSGGADSMALLIALYHALRATASSSTEDVFDRITALHFNHQIHPDSDTWQNACMRCCKGLKIKFDCGKWDQPPAQVINEGNAREARYRWFSEVVESDQILLTAHHADDQAETVMMHLFQGHGLTRLKGIPSVRPLKFGDSRKVYRPLLGFPRESLREYLKRHQVQWINDPTNQDLRITRNFVRAQLMPLVKKRWPDVLNSIAASAANLSSVNQLLDLNLEKSLGELETPEAKRVFCLLPPLKIALLLPRSRFEFCQLLRRWIHKAGLPAPSEAQLGSLHQQLRERHEKSLSQGAETNYLRCKLHWKHLNIISYGRYLYVIPDLIKPPSRSISCTITSQDLTNDLSVTFLKNKASGISADLIESGELTWCWRKGGEKLNLPGRDHRSSLKKVLQQNRIPEWERDYLPFLEFRGEVVWVSGIGVSRNFLHADSDVEMLIPHFSLRKNQNKSF